MGRNTFFAGIFGLMLIFGMTVVSVETAYADEVIWSGAGLEAVVGYDGRVYLNDTNRGICLVYMEQKSLYARAFEVACNGETRVQVTSAASLAAAISRYIPGGQGASAAISAATAIYNFWCTFG
jgi:hypothetical protein